MTELFDWILQTSQLIKEKQFSTQLQVLSHLVFLQ